MVRRIVHLIRHEKTQANLERRYIGHTNQSIVKPVEVQALHAPPIVYGSDLARCIETATCYFPRAYYVADPRLRELNFGDFEMKTYEDLKENIAYRTWIDNPYKYAPPNGESFYCFQQRVMEAFEYIQQEESTFVVHGGVIQMLLSQLLARDFYTVQAQHRTLYTLEWRDGRWKLLSEAPITVNDSM